MKKALRFLKSRIFLYGIITGLLAAYVVSPVPSARATARPLGALKTPAANINLAVNTIANIPDNEGFCTITIWNNTTEPVYWGGASGGTYAVTTAAGMPICTDPLVCRDSTVTVNVMAGGIGLIAANNVNGIRYVMGSGC